MNKKILQLFIFIGLFLVGLGNIFAFDAQLKIDKIQTDINDYIKLSVVITSNQGGEIGITDIKGLDNFELIGQSQRQSSSSNIVVIDGKTQSKTITSHTLDLTLKAKSKGDFEIGPAILKKGAEEIKTNSVKIKVSGDNLFINNNHLNINTRTSSNTNNNNKTSLDSKTNENNNIEKYESVEYKDFDNNNKLYLLLGILIFGGLLIYFLLKNNPALLNKNIDSSKENKKQKNKKDLNIEKLEDKEVDFETLKKDIIYPDINSDKFINKISDIFREKVKTKYRIFNIENKSFEEISQEIGDDNHIGELIKLINKSKYSNIIGDNNKILNLVKEI